MAPEPVSPTDSLTQERLRQHRSTAPLAVVATVVVALTVPLLVGNRIDPRIGLGWMLGLAGAMAVRLAVAWLHGRRPDSARPTTWLWRYRTAYALHGAVWLLTALVVAHQPGPLPGILLVLIYTLMAAGGLISASFDWVAGLVFALPTAVPLLAQLFVPQAQLEGVATLAATLLFLFVMAGTLFRSERSLRLAVQQRQQLDDQNRLQRQLLATMPQGCWFIDREGRTTDVNDAMCVLLGRSREDLVGRRVSDCFSGEDQALMQAQLDRRALGEAGAYPMRITRPDGSRRHCQNHAAPLLDGAGRHQGSVGFWTDVTPIVVAAEALRVHEWALNAITAAVSVLSEDGVYRMVNDTWCLRTGLSREQVVHRSAEAALPAVAFAPDRLAAFRACLETGTVQALRGTVNVPGLEDRVIETFMYPYGGDAGSRCAVLVSHDVTDEVRNLDALRNHDAEQRALLDAFPGYIVRIDPQGVYQYVNAQAAQLYATTPEAMVGRTALQCFGPERAALIADDCARALAGEKVELERWIPPAGGRPATCVQIQTTLGKHPVTGEPVLYSFGVDVTERHRAHRAMAAARADAERANGAKSQFLAHMSHELRTPMNAILGFAQLLASDPQTRLGAEQQAWLQQIQRGGEHLLGLINEVLDLGRVEAGHLPLDLRPVPLGPLVQALLAMVRPLAQARDVHLLPLPEGDAAPTVLADPLRLRQVLLNLLGNAIKFNRPGGDVALSWRVQSDGVRIAVRDTGPGIAPTDQQRLFEPFERLGAERSGVEGTGIGLTLSRRLVQAMGGDIGMNSHPGTGSTFWLRLPEALAEAAAPGHRSAGSSARPWALPPEAGIPAGLSADRAVGAAGAGPATVLYIEDNPVNLILMEAMLSRLPGVHSVCVMSPTEGLALALQAPPDLVLLDLHMPGMDGFQVLQRLREDEATRAVPVCAVSANALRPDIEAALQAGFAAYLTKPIQLDTLSDTVRRLLDRRPSLAAI